MPANSAKQHLENPARESLACVRGPCDGELRIRRSLVGHFLRDTHRTLRKYASDMLCAGFSSSRVMRNRAFRRHTALPRKNLLARRPPAHRPWRLGASTFPPLRLRAIGPSQARVALAARSAKATRETTETKLTKARPTDGTDGTDRARHTVRPPGRPGKDIPRVGHPGASHP